MTALLTLNNVAMRYPSPSGSSDRAHSVFDGINLEVQRGERLGVVGRNGVGKSTLLRIMAKIFAPYSGEVTWAHPAARNGAGCTPLHVVAIHGKPHCCEVLLNYRGRNNDVNITDDFGNTALMLPPPTTAPSG